MDNKMNVGKLSGNLNISYHLKPVICPLNKIVETIPERLSENGILFLKEINTRPLYTYYRKYFLDMIISQTTSLYFKLKKEFTLCLDRDGFIIIKEEDLFDSLKPYDLLICNKPGVVINYD